MRERELKNRAKVRKSEYAWTRVLGQIRKV